MFRPALLEASTKTAICTRFLLNSRMDPTGDDENSYYSTSSNSSGITIEFMSADEEETYTAAAAGNPGAVQRSPLEPLASMANTPLLNHRRDPPAKQPLQLGNLQFIPKQGCPKTAFIENWLDTQQNKGPPKLGETKAYSSSIGDVSTAKDETFATTNSQKDLTNEQGAVGEKQNISANK